MSEHGYNIAGLNDVARRIRDWRISKEFPMPNGFFDTNELLAKIALMHSELGEASEAVRKGDEPNFIEELADTVIRILDVTASLGFDLAGAIEAKMLVNEGRPIKHGKLA